MAASRPPKRHPQPPPDHGPTREVSQTAASRPSEATTRATSRASGVPEDLVGVLHELRRRARGTRRAHAEAVRDREVVEADDERVRRRPARGPASTPASARTPAIPAGLVDEEQPVRVVIVRERVESGGDAATRLRSWFRLSHSATCALTGGVDDLRVDQRREEPRRARARSRRRSAARRRDPRSSRNRSSSAVRASPRDSMRVAHPLVADPFAAARSPRSGRPPSRRARRGPRQRQGGRAADGRHTPPMPSPDRRCARSMISSGSSRAAVELRPRPRSSSGTTPRPATGIVT